MEFVEKYVSSKRKSSFLFKKSLKKSNKLVSTSRNIGSSLKIDFPVI